MMNKSDFRAFCIAQVGKPYVLGADGPRAFDCSGLVLAAWRKVVTTLGDTTAAGIWNMTRSVTVPRVGDAVFLANHSGRPAPPGFSRGIGHVAVITSKLSNGDWEIVEARGRAAGVVRTTLSYWKTRAYYAGVRRYPALTFEPTVPATVVTTGIPHPLVVDGDPGQKTYDAFQWSVGIPRTGLFDSATREALCNWLGSDMATGQIVSGDVKRLQRWVDETADGDWGTKTSIGWQRWLNVLIYAAMSRTATVGGPVAFNFGFFNGQDPRFGGSTDYVGRARLIKQEVSSSIMVGTETNKPMRDAILGELGPTWWAYVHGSRSVCVIANLAKWQPPKPIAVSQVSFGDGYHGAIMVPIVSEANLAPLRVTGTHTRPKAVASLAEKSADISAALHLASQGILSGDFALDADSRLPYWKRVTPDVDTMDAAGDQHVDAGYIKGASLQQREPGVIINPGTLSDHKWGRAHLRLLPKEPTT